MNSEIIIKNLKSHSNPENIKGMARFGISSNNTLGVNIPKIREIAKQSGKNHSLALELWETEIHEARILASMIDEPNKVTEIQMEKWVSDFDSWDVCDQCCSNLFDKTPFALKKIFEWTKREEEFVKRAGFVLMATTAVHNKNLEDKIFHLFFPIIIREAVDERNFVKKAVNWALRQIGKRNKNLHKAALETAKIIQKIPSKSARWIAGDAIREFSNEKIISRIKDVR